MKKNGKNYCPDCLKIYEDNKVKRDDFNLLYEYICKIYMIEKPTMLMFRQIKDFKNEGYTEIGIYYTLKYYYETLEKKVLEGSGLGIVPFYYEQAKLHINKKFDIEDKIEDFQSQEARILIHTSLPKDKYQKHKELPLNIDWESIDEND